MTFKDENRALQELARELSTLRAYNKAKAAKKDFSHLLMFAEGALTCLTLEHFVRVVVAQALDGANLFSLLEFAVARGLIQLPWADQKEGIKKVCAVRNTLLHGNFKQAAQEAKCASIQEYFQNQYAGEVEQMFNIADHVMKQIDISTGQPFSKSGQSLRDPARGPRRRRGTR
jgi:hypothetical protein